MFRTSCTICPPLWLWQMWIWRSPEQRRTRRTTGHNAQDSSRHTPCIASEHFCVLRQTWHWPDGYSPASCQSSICGTQDVTQGVTQENSLDRKIENAIKENLKVTTEDLAKQFGVTSMTIKRHLAKMPHIRYVGSGNSGHWEVLDKE